MSKNKAAGKNARYIVLAVATLILMAVVPWIVSFIPNLKKTNGAQSFDNLANLFQNWLDRGYIHNYISAVTNTQLLIGSGLVILICILGLVLFLGPQNFLVNNRSGKGNKYGPASAGNGEFGNARWQTQKEMEESTTVWKPGMSGNPKAGGVVLGVDTEGGKEKFYISSDDTHTLIIGTTRSGKTRRIILPTIWELAAAGESMVMTDPKAELYLDSKEYLEQNGYTVVAMNFREPEKSTYWNPLDKVVQNIKKGDISNAEQAAHDIVESLISITQKSSSDSFWQNTGKSLIASIIMMLAIEADDDKERHLFAANVLLGKYGRPDDYDRVPLSQIIDKLPYDHPTSMAFLTAGISGDKTRASVFANALTAIQVFADRKIGYITSRQDHDFRDIASKKMAVFLIIPDERSTYNVLATIYINQLYQSLIEVANENGGRLPRRVNFLLDEFGNIPSIPDFAGKLTVAGGRGMKFTVAVQALDQLEKRYDKEANTIKGNCHTWIYLLTADTKTAKEIEERIGKYTIATTSSGVSQQYGGANLRPSASNNTNLTGRSLVMATDLTEWKAEDGALVLRVREKPARYPAPDMSQLRVNKDFGLGNPAETLAAQKRRNDALPIKDIRVPRVWLPSVAGFKTKYISNYELDIPTEAEITVAGNEPVIGGETQVRPAGDQADNIDALLALAQAEHAPIAEEEREMREDAIMLSENEAIPVKAKARKETDEQIAEENAALTPKPRTKIKI